MKSRSYFTLILILTFSTFSLGAVTCPTLGGTPNHNWCGPYTITMDYCVNGAGGNGCTGGNYPFTTISPVDDIYSNYSFYGINASEITGAVTTDVAPNGAVGEYQYLQFASGTVQAFEKNAVTDATGDSGEIFANSNGAPTPQPVTNLFSFSGISECNQPTSDVNVSFDHISSDGNFVVAGIAQPDNQNSGVYKTLCIAVSTVNDLDSCIGQQGCPWNSYMYNITSMLPNPTSDLADYPRFGTWSDGYYMAFDFITHPGNVIEGTAVCQLNRTAFLQGIPDTTGAICYSRLTQSQPPMVHTILPADAETKTATGTQGEFFMATVNPGADGAPCTETPPSNCPSDQLAYWTWKDISSSTPPDWSPVAVNSFIPGCYDVINPSSGNHDPAYTNCIPQYKSSALLDSVGDRLMSPLAYRYIDPSQGCDEHSKFAPSCEYLAVTQTIQLNGTSYGTQTGVRYYTMVAPTTATGVPNVIYQGNFYDTSEAQSYYWLPSNAIDANQNVGYTFSESSTTSAPPSFIPNH